MPYRSATELAAELLDADGVHSWFPHHTAADGALLRPLSDYVDVLAWALREEGVQVDSESDGSWSAGESLNDTVRALADEAFR